MGKARHYIDGYRVLEEETEAEERIIFDYVEDYDLNHNFFSRAKVTVSSEEEINEEEVLDRIEQEIIEPIKNEEEELPEEWNLLRKLFNIYYDFYGADPTYEATIRYVGGDFPRREILIKFY